jgi:hypothetical protein
MKRSLLGENQHGNIGSNVVPDQMISTNEWMAEEWLHTIVADEKDSTPTHSDALQRGVSWSMK